MPEHTAFITGATGFVGGQLAQLLLERGWRLLALRREGSTHPDLEGLDIDWRFGDLRNPATVHRAMAGAGVVFHVAADYRLWSRHPAELYASNVTGTDNVLRAAMEHRVERVVYTSSVGALGLRRDGVPADETTPVSLADMVGHYKRSKFLAERKAEEYARLGLPVVIVHPSTPVGPGDHKPTPTGQIIVDFLNRRMPAYVDTGLNLIHVRDVAWGHLLACEHGAVGEKYILGHRNLRLSAILQSLAAISGLPSPRVRLPHRPVLLLAHGNEMLARLTGKAPRIPVEGVRMARRLMFFHAGKAVSQLGLPQTPVEQALQEAVAWFRDHGYVKR
jgi:dihydroflavonol-4-reductase